MSEIICDFCSASDPGWGYPAKDFQAYECGGMVGESVGGWAACNTCHALIEAGDREGLMQRTLAMAPFVGDEEVWDFMRELHGLFFEHRCGPAVQVVTAEELN